MIPQIALAAALALLWVGATGVTTIPNLFAGTLIAALVLVYLHGRGGDIARRVWRAIALLVYFFWELVVANLRPAWEIITPRFYIQAGIIGVPLDAESDFEIWLLATMITLTPGTLSVDVSRDRHVLWVHGMYIDDRDEFVRSIKDGFERRLLEITR
jgi:multicomponent Na+:H+ antiporter subunit E